MPCVRTFSFPVFRHSRSPCTAYAVDEMVPASSRETVIVGGLPFVSGRARIIAVAVRSGNLAVLVVDDQLGTLVSTDFPCSVDGLPLGVAVSGGTFRSAPFDIPSAIGVGNNVM